MCAFEINFFSRKQEFYKFATDDFALLEIGIGNYNVSSISNFFSVDETSFAELKPINADIKEFFSNQSPSMIINKLIGTDSLSTMQILAYDEDAKKYKMRTGWTEIKKLNTTKYKTDKYTEPSETNIKDFLKKWNQIQVGIVTEPKIVAGYKVVAHRIQNSASGCITFNANLQILNSSRDSLIRLFLLDSKDNESSRTVSFNGSPFIAAIPQTAEGLRYGYSNTLNAGVGNYEKTSGDENNPADKVAGQLRMTWDPATKTWESGTQQILVRLVDNIDAANIPDLTGQELLNMSHSEVYDVPPEENPIMGKVPKGRGIVVSTENGNPNQFGPNFRGGCGNNTKKSIVKVVNRSQRAYREGALVVCSLINGEWLIVSGEGSPVDPKRSLLFGRFEYQQYIISANLYFTSPNSNIKLLPTLWEEKIRNHYYDRSNLDNETKILNSIASSIKGLPEDKDPRLYLTESFEDSNQRVLAMLRLKSENDIGVYDDDNKLIENIKALDFIDTFYCDPDSTVQYVPPDLEHEYAVPKNILAKSNDKFLLNLPAVQNGPEESTDQFAVPMFWGALFPDGYYSTQCSKFLGPLSLDTLTIFKEDPNFKDLSVGATTSLPYMEDDENTLKRVLYYNSLKENISGNPLDLIRNTGGWYRPLSIFKGVLKDKDALNSYIDRGSLSGLYPTINKEKLSKGIYGLEPTNPRKLQFSPMALDFLYAKSTLNEAGFDQLKINISGYRSQNLPTSGVTKLENRTLYDYAVFLWSSAMDQGGPYLDETFSNNTYNISQLSYSTSFGLQTSNTVQRHPAPLGVVDGNEIIPPFGGNPRSPLMPITTIKSVIRTNAQKLTFTTAQYFGNPPKTTIAGGQGPGLTLLPIGVGIGWNTPANPIQVNSIPQWGDRNRTDDIDSFGTDALHVRIFEHWPEDQTIYLGPIYTPLHFNPSDTLYANTYSYDNETKTIKATPVYDDDGELVLTSTPVDFTEPTVRNGDSFTTISAGQIVTKETLASVGDWSINTIRRGQLLTGGGFAYFKKVIGITEPIPSGRGLNYKNNDQFMFPDGSIITVTVGTSGAIQGISKIEPNYSDRYIIKDTTLYSDITSLSAQPDYLGDTGEGATFSFKGIGCKIVEYDAPPKEIVPITRITPKSNDGKNYVDETITTTVDLEKAKGKDFDIFYFFHNDPTAYGYALVYNNQNAHYVISEVNPA